MFEWILTALSLLGTWYNIQKKVAGWYIWSVSNVGWVICFTMKGMAAEATLFAIYLVLSIYGIIKWGGSKSKGQGNARAKDGA
ncbi:MAG: nicotinamide mononucleotide transporter family protein [Proteobacteria bacterium]|nr:nicotinamide mononucleotide transporter family protein [Pseudomonadota bacterium]MBU1710699.1 nicotinamide mononucleotide transporter family protein [Pseudomonadota bacterium]